MGIENKSIELHKAVNALYCGFITIKELTGAYQHSTCPARVWETHVNFGILMVIIHTTITATSCKGHILDIVHSRGLGPRSSELIA